MKYIIITANAPIKKYAAGFDETTVVVAGADAINVCAESATASLAAY